MYLLLFLTFIVACKGSWSERDYPVESLVFWWHFVYVYSRAIAGLLMCICSYRGMICIVGALFWWLKVVIWLWLYSYLNWLCTWLLFLFSCHNLPLFCTHVDLQNPGSNSVMLQFYAIGSRACPLERSCQHCFCCFICWIKAQSDMNNIWFVLWYMFLSATTNI